MLKVVRSYGRTSKFFRLDGLLLFCIIMGLRSASSATDKIQVLHHYRVSIFALSDGESSSFFQVTFIVSPMKIFHKIMTPWFLGLRYF